MQKGKAKKRKTAPPPAETFEEYLARMDKRHEIVFPCKKARARFRRRKEKLDVMGADLISSLETYHFILDNEDHNELKTRAMLDATGHHLSCFQTESHNTDKLLKTCPAQDRAHRERFHDELLSGTYIQRVELRSMIDELEKKGNTILRKLGYKDTYTKVGRRNRLSDTERLFIESSFADLRLD